MNRDRFCSNADACQLTDAARCDQAAAVKDQFTTYGIIIFIVAIRKTYTIAVIIGRTAGDGQAAAIVAFIDNNIALGIQAIAPIQVFITCMGNGAVSLEDQIEGFCVAIVDGCAVGRTEIIFPCIARTLVGVAIEGQGVGIGIIGNLTVAEYVGCIVRGDLCAADPEGVAGCFGVSIGDGQRRSAVIFHLGNQLIAFRILDGDDNLVCACVIGNARDAAVDLGDGVLISTFGGVGDLSEVSQRFFFRCRFRGACRHGCIFCHCRQVEGKGLCIVPVAEFLGQLKLHVDGIGHFRDPDFLCDLARCIDDRTLVSIKSAAHRGQNTDAFAEGQIVCIYAIQVAGAGQAAARDLNAAIIGVHAITAKVRFVAGAGQAAAHDLDAACGHAIAELSGSTAVAGQAAARDLNAVCTHAIAAAARRAAVGRHGAARDGEVSARHINTVATALTAGRFAAGTGQAAGAGDRDAAGGIDTIAEARIAGHSAAGAGQAAAAGDRDAAVIGIDAVALA